MWEVVVYVIYVRVKGLRLITDHWSLRVQILEVLRSRLQSSTFTNASLLLMVVFFSLSLSHPAVQRPGLSYFG